MPFTPSHAVVALPFLRTPLVPAAIAIGAMTPDLPLFVRGTPLQYGRTHDLVWLPATVLVALGLLLVWRCILRPATRELAPVWLARRLPGEWDAGARAAWGETFPRRVSAILLLIASLAIGVVSHIVWDLFTHEARWGVELFPLLDENWGPLTGYKWLQHGSSVIGLVIIGIWMLVWLSRRTPVGRLSRVIPDAVRWIWWLSLPAILVGAWFVFLPLYGGFDEHFGPAHLAYRVLPPACALWGVLSVVLCVVVQLRRRNADREDPTPATRES
ncbi:hypothetical protein GCM10009775_26780 [Microbacterium aoyamense]|uniref:Cell wall anchor protein n=1 Tax=Microbacterium aoyamense TaxID=344166 RepID=A0ABP5B6B8_9MICO|nr:DUF4184 family protein [Microbacterium aoyamense]